MSETDDGGPAFPAERYEPNDPAVVEAFGEKFVSVTYPGMTLRDWFAGQALAAIIQADGIQYAGNSKSRASHAAMAYAHADAMLAERAKASSP